MFFLVYIRSAKIKEINLKIDSYSNFFSYKNDK